MKHFFLNVWCFVGCLLFSGPVQAFDMPTSENAKIVDNTLSFSHEAGFYTSSFYLKIISLNGDSVFYTLDGSIPTVNALVYQDSMLFDNKVSAPNYFSLIPTTPIQSLISYKAWELSGEDIDKANIIRCASFKSGVRSSEIYTMTFFVDSMVFNKYTLPVISLVTDSLNLFSYDTGIYVPGKYFIQSTPEWTGNYNQRGKAWERNVHIEYFDQLGRINFGQYAGLRIHGGITRQAAQKSLRLYARKEYGNKSFDYQLLTNRENDKYKRFLLRATMGTGERQTIISDVLAHEIIRGLNIEYQEYMPVIVFINGEYWGIHTLRDRIDERYISYLYNIDKDSIVIIEDYNDDESFKKLFEFIDINDISVSANYEYIASQIDIDNYIDYQIAEMFLNNYDWPGNNMKIWKSGRKGSKWRWIFYDLDQGFGNYEYNMFDHVTLNDSNVVWPNPPISTLIFRKLMQNNDFVDRFISRYAELLNTYFDTEIMIAKLDSVRSLYENEIPAHINRWHYPDSDEKWNHNVDSILEDFLKNRPCIVENQIMSFFQITSFGFKCFIIDEVIDNNEIFVILPNPCQGLLYIFNNSTDPVEGDLLISDLAGKILYTKKSITLGPWEKKKLDLSGLPNSTYILRFHNNTFNETRKLLLIR
jgi:CotH kinase protein/Secretion system C-terminal sorting domain/Fn3 associated